MIQLNVVEWNSGHDLQVRLKDNEILDQEII